MSGVAPDPLDRIAERLSACLEVVVESEYRAPVATGWYAEDVLALVEVARAARPVVENARPRPDYPGQMTLRDDDHAHLAAALGKLK